MAFDLASDLLGQLEFHWERQLRPRLGELGDDEYFWEPAPGAWGLRRRSVSGHDEARLLGEFTVPPPEPPPVTTIGWRIRHLVGVVSGMRAMPPFGGPAFDVMTFPSPPTASAALDQLDGALRAWMTAVRALDRDALESPAGPAGGPLEGWTVAGIVLHVHREVIHHGAEIALLRDLHRARGARTGATGTEPDVVASGPAPRST